MEFGYLGGMGKGPRPTLPGFETWSHPVGDVECFAQTAGCARLYTWDALALLVRGYARPAGSSGHLDLDAAAEEARSHYLEYGDLAVESLEGSFTLALLDGLAGKVFLYRNLVGAGATYYHDGPGGFLYGGNLADLVDASGRSPLPNREVLPSFFLFRTVPGRDTLFHGFSRLLPGEHVTWDGHNVRRQQWHTWGSFRRTFLPARDCLDALDCTSEQVLRDIAAHRPKTANLLSGGIDSSYLQAIWNKVGPGDDPLQPSWSITVDHPRTWAETDYAITASRRLGTRHTLVPADGPFADYLLETIAATGEGPNHAQAAYFPHLARAMAARGLTGGLCGEAADSLFGLGLANQLHNARLLKKLVPGAWPRTMGAGIAGLCGWNRLRDTFRLANHLEDYSYLDHPVNRVVAFTDWDAVESCFGKKSVAEAAAARRALLDQHEIGDDPLLRLHGVTFLGEALDTASYWCTLFNTAGVDLFCPFLDSRMLRLAIELPPRVRFPFRRPKDLLKKALARQAPASLVNRPKLGFGQPIFEWLAPGGQLRSRVDAIGRYEFVDQAALARAKEKPNWFLYTLLCYDLWHKQFIERTLPRTPRRPLMFRSERSEVQMVH